MTFDQAITIILYHEGGYVNHPSDPGGETNFGITKKYYPNVNIKNLTVDQAKAIYKKDYWDKNQIGTYPDEVRLHLFDMAVNMGMGNAIRVMQRALNMLGAELTIDGVAGPKTRTLLTNTLAGACGYAFPAFLTISRIKYYTNLVTGNKKLSVFLLGWIKRANDIQDKSLEV